MVTVLVENQQKKLRLNLSKIKKIARAVLRRHKISKATLSLVFVSSQKIRSYNKKYLKRTYATDVLAFNLSGGSKELIGDVVISTDAVIQNAKRYNQSRYKEISLYIIHGVLHLVGFDDHKKADRVRMRNKEEDHLNFLGSHIKTVLR